MSTRIAKEGYIFKADMLRRAADMVFNKVESEYILAFMIDYAKQKNLNWKAIHKKNAFAELAKVLNKEYSKRSYFCHSCKGTKTLTEMSKQNISFCRACRKEMVRLGFEKPWQKPKEYYKTGRMAYIGIV